MSRKPLVWGGLALAGGAGYYLYSAGGDPKVAKKEFETDATKVQNRLTGHGNEAKKEGEEAAQKIGSKFDSTIASARKEISEADKTAQQKAEQWKKEGVEKFDKVRKETGAELSQTIDKFDKTVEKKTAEAKSGISSWFGLGGGK